MIRQNINLVEKGPFFGRDLSVFINNMSRPRHRWYEFKEGFSTELVNEALERVQALRKNRRVTILDPFVGSGTSLLSAISRGHRAVGIEVNPFLAFAASAKTVPGPWERNEFIKARDQILDADINEGASFLEGFSTFTQKSGFEKWLFNKDVLRAFWSYQKNALKLAPKFSGPFRLALLSAAIECSNVKRDGKCLRYRKNWKDLNLSSENFRETFLRRSNILYEDVEALPLKNDLGLQIIRGDAREVLDKVCEPSSIDLVITSPPYLNSFDYSDVYRPELFLGEFVRSNSELRMIRQQTVRSHVQVAWPKTNTYKSLILENYVQALRSSENLWDHRLPDMVQAYFDDMFIILSKLKRLVKLRGQIWFVVSTSAYGGNEIPVDLLLAEVGEVAGLHLDSIHILRRLRSSGQHWQSQGKKPPLRESLIIWEPKE